MFVVERYLSAVSPEELAAAVDRDRRAAEAMTAAGIAMVDGRAKTLKPPNAHDRPDDGPVNFGDKEQIAIDRKFLAEGRSRVVVRRAAERDCPPQVDHGLFVRFPESANLHGVLGVTDL